MKDFLIIIKCFVFTTVVLFGLTLMFVPELFDVEKFIRPYIEPAGMGIVCVVMISVIINITRDNHEEN